MGNARPITTTLLATAATLTLLSRTASAQQHPRITGAVAHAGKTLFVKPGKNKILHDQNGDDAGIYAVSQNFQSTFDAYDCQAADDFTVPADSKWMVKEIDISGHYFDGLGLARNENVTVYKDKSGLPGKPVAYFNEIAGVDDGLGNFVLTLPDKGVRLKPGTYWLSVQVNMDYGVGGEWGWERTSVQDGNPAAWQNPGGGFQRGCATWGVETECLGFAPGADTDDNDNMFTLKGKAVMKE
jgi:hypothetical protein